MQRCTQLQGQNKDFIPDQSGPEDLCILSCIMGPKNHSSVLKMWGEVSRLGQDPNITEYSFNSPPTPRPGPPFTPRSGPRATGHALEWNPQGSHLGNPVLTQKKPSGSCSQSGEATEPSPQWHMEAKTAVRHKHNQQTDSLGPSLRPAPGPGVKLALPPPLLGQQPNHVIIHPELIRTPRAQPPGGSGIPMDKYQLSTYCAPGVGAQYKENRHDPCPQGACSAVRRQSHSSARTAAVLNAVRRKPQNLGSNPGPTSRQLCDTGPISNSSVTQLFIHTMRTALVPTFRGVVRVK